METTDVSPNLSRRWSQTPPDDRSRENLHQKSCPDLTIMSTACPNLISVATEDDQEPGSGAESNAANDAWA
jgi:hypothetical protein